MPSRRRAPPAPGRPVLRLEEVRRRLEFLLAAVYGRPIPIVAQPVKPPSWAARLFGAARPPAEPLPASDAERVHLPAELDAPEGEAAALARYRLLAVSQAERLVRGTAAFTPDADARWNAHLYAAGLLDRREHAGRVRDLYLLLENAAADAALVRAIPRLAPALRAERARALAARPAPEGLTPAEREMEALVRRILSLEPGEAPPELAPGATPEESLRLARRLAAGLPRGRYRGVAAVPAWGAILRPAQPAEPGQGAPQGPQLQAGRPRWWMLLLPAAARPGWKLTVMMPGAGTGQGNPADAGKGGGQGTQPASGPDAAPPEPDPDHAPPEPDVPPAKPAADSAGGPPHAGAAGTPAAGTGVPRGAAEAEAGTPYPEWNWERESYEPRGATVRTVPPHPGDDEWAAAVLAAHGAVVRRLRERFERMRAQRRRLMAQRRGDELDVGACVRALVDLRTGHSPDDRLYAEVRPARRGVAITLLVDVSGSTDEFVGKARIIDVEKVAVLLTSEALDALGDLYSILTFSSLGAENVRVRSVKDFGERNGRTVRQRIGALRPEGYTRMGAAIRHATSALARTHSGHRLLLIVSDGKPNDRDHYQGTFAVEDARQAVAEARAAGVHPFCLTVDRAAPAYATRIFGPAGHMILRHPDQLPNALLQVVRRILASR